MVAIAKPTYRSVYYNYTYIDYRQIFAILPDSTCLRYYAVLIITLFAINRKQLCNLGNYNIIIV